jgi:nicotinate-nucleotide adenylyltransferase
VKIAIFGGTFDPVHTGHMAAAKAAAEKLRLDRILFVPTGCPPHKITDGLTPFHHRFAMVALACTGDPRFVPSLLEAPDAKGSPRYSINTARRVKRLLGVRDRLYFLIGVDAFLDIPHWKQFRRLLDLVNFIVTSRPGFNGRRIQSVVPPDLLVSRTISPESSRIKLRRTSIQILHGVEVPVASRGIRKAVRQGGSVRGQVPALVEQYILKEKLYRPGNHPFGGR